MPFVVPYAPQQIYTPNGRLVDLIRAQGQDAARAAEQRGRDQALLWSGVGNSINQGVGNVLQAQAQAPRIAIEQEQAKRLAGENADTAALRSGQRTVDTMMAGDQLPAGDVGPRQENYLTPDGLFDVTKMNAALAKSGIAHLAPELLTGAERINEAVKKSQEHDQVAAQHKALLFGDMADGVLKLAKVGMPIPAAMDFVVQPGLATKQINPQEYAQIRQQIGALPPEQQTAALTSFMDAAAKLDKGDTLAEGAKHVDRYGRTEASNAPKPPAPSKAGFAAIANDTTKTPEERAAAAKSLADLTPVPPVTSNEWKDVLLDGKPAKVFVDPKTKTVTDLAGQVIDNPTARIKPVPTATQIRIDANARGVNLPSWATDDVRPSGPDANKPDPSIKMTPNGLHQAALNFIANGQYPPTGRGSDATAIAQREAITSKVGAIAAASGMDVPQLRAFYKSNAGSLAQQQKAYDVAAVSIAKADRDVDLLEKVLPKIGDTGSPLFNKPLRSFEQSVAGNEDMSEFATRLRSVQNEYTRILNASLTGGGGGVMSDSARHETDQLLDPKATVGQMLRSIAALKSEGGNRLLSQGEQIQRIQQRMQGGPTGQPAAAPTAAAPSLVPTLRFNPATGKLEKVGG